MTQNLIAPGTGGSIDRLFRKIRRKRTRHPEYTFGGSERINYTWLNVRTFAGIDTSKMKVPCIEMGDGRQEYSVNNMPGSLRSTVQPRKSRRDPVLNTLTRRRCNHETLVPCGFQMLLLCRESLGHKRNIFGNYGSSSFEK